MALVIKCVMGSTCAVTGLGIPAFMSTGGDLTSWFQKVSASGTAIKQISMEECKSQENGQTTSIEYGDQNSTSVCWKVDWQDQTSITGEESKAHYTQLFKDMWNNKTGNWNTGGSGKWTSSCMKGTEKWVMTGMEGGKEYLGWCYEDQTSSQANSEKLFVKKDVTSSSQETEDSQKTVKVSVCVGDCFNEKTATGGSEGIKQWEGEKGTWKEVTFNKQ